VSGILGLNELEADPQPVKVLFDVRYAFQSMTFTCNRVEDNIVRFLFVSSVFQFTSPRARSRYYFKKVKYNMDSLLEQ